MIDLFEELLAIADLFERESLRYALVGGLAYSLHVEARATEDIDFLIPPEEWSRVPGILHPLGYLPLSDEMNFDAIRIRRLTKLKEDEDALVLDFLLGEGRFADAFDQAIMYPLRGIQIPVAHPRTLIELKLLRMSPKDQGDIEGLRRLLDESSDPE